MQIQEKNSRQPVSSGQSQLCTSSAAAVIQQGQAKGVSWVLHSFPIKSEFMDILPKLPQVKLLLSKSDTGCISQILSAVVFYNVETDVLLYHREASAVVVFIPRSICLLLL